MHIFLYGPPGTGKTTIGQALARDLGLPFLDLDGLIESKAGLSIARIMEGQGEPAFRDLESAALREAMGLTPGMEGPDERVIALGGGALLRQENRDLAEKHGDVVLLTAELPTLMARLQDEADKRPLLAGDLHASLPALLERRREHYASFGIRVQVDGLAAEQAALQVQGALGRFHLRAMGEYDVRVGPLERLGGSLGRPGKMAIVTDKNVAGLHLDKVRSVLRASGCKPASIVLPAGEEHKTLDTASRLWNGFLENALDRRSSVVALGGGVIGDLAGFAAATYMRGIDWICLPTTLLSMADASLGGKTGVDLPQGKNLVGSFHPPKLVLADPRFLDTLPREEFISGMAEVVKHGIISDPGLFELCGRGLDGIRAHLGDVVRRAMAVKIRVIEADPYEAGYRAALNLGHTVGHAVELASRFRLRHGEAVAIGMAVEAGFAERIGLAKTGLSTTISDTLSGLGLPVRIPPGLAREELLRAMRVDKKKNADRVRFALPAGIGSVELVDVVDLESVLA